MSKITNTKSMEDKLIRMSFLLILGFFCIMQCAKLHLQDRSKTKPIKSERPRRFCQKRMVDPGHEEDPRWNDTMFHCNDVDVDIKESNETNKSQSGNDLVLSVQNLQFSGNIEQKIRARTGFKYKSLNDHQQHRMFVKEVVEDLDQHNADCTSELSNYFDNYAKYFMNNENSRASSSKSSIVLCNFTNKHTENKAVQVDMGHHMKKKHKFELKPKKSQKNNVHPSENNIKDIEDEHNDTKIAFHKNGKRKSLTIARNESPATLQIIRVDVVCNYSCSSTMSDYEEFKKTPRKEINKENQISNLKSGLKDNKRYMLTNTVKTLDENISSGKVTLMCKTFKMTDRSKNIYNKNNSSCIDPLKKTQVRV